MTARVGFGGGLTLALRSTNSAAYLELAQGGTPLAWHTLDSEVAGALVCATAGSLRNCIAVTGVGAHGANAYPVVVDGTRLEVGDPANTDTPVIDGKDLDGDNRVDALALLNDYDPSYAAGQVQWQTFRRSADGLRLTPTGCGPLSTNHEPPPKPTTLQYGVCHTG